MSDSQYYTKLYSTFLIRLAWAVEIVAVLIGFTISVVVAISAYQSFADISASLLDSSSAILVASLPFVLIALVEICKIPLTFAFLTVKSIGWRILFLSFVLFLCLITFETMFNGFERNFSNLNRAIDQRNNQIDHLHGEISLLEKRRAHTVRFSEEALREEVDATLDNHQAQYQTAVLKINNTSAKALQNIDFTFEDALATERRRLEDLRDTYYDQWRNETAQVEGRFSALLTDNIRGSADERQRLLQDLTELKTEMDGALKRANFLTRAGVENKYRNLVNNKEAQLARITTSYLGADAIEKQSAMEAELKAQLDFVNSKYSGRVDEVNERLALLKEDLTDRTEQAEKQQVQIRQSATAQRTQVARVRNQQDSQTEEYLNGKLIELEAFMQQAFLIDEEVFKLTNKQSVLQTQINHLINQNQIYRLAMYAFGKESADQVAKADVGIIGFIWFGSLSLIASVCGVMLALAGFYLRRFSTDSDISPGG